MQNTDDKNIDNEKATNEEALDATVVDTESSKELETEDQNIDDKDNISIKATDEDLSFKASYEKASAAVAISYNEEKKSPFVSALGYESRAQAIIDMAKELGVYVHKDPVLLNELKALKEGEQVPEQLFQIIAEILAFSYLLQGKTPESYVRADGTKAINTKA
ncbi:MAG: EscU/YscU/HrcU family type III secretion system export apparatus switch protein [Succinivibrio sp.]|nr:EscU/YscU/HrcU family type III secretion system export apparatus switch protein [Succinivibrio sp.]MCI7253071.1 EscU/YscU/HrcU family type III secretion system export apparatus switch protein [Succinatimonas sp.]MDD6376470.1 EscU/YscU/HrcU family type III secretion system export apparatus switch protein [Succinatimonas sp.]MDY5064047.1 EscU/YscU/HrcU family type III secretion system export apparatus switch protein [Succinivibrio sp.]MDY5994013.1 EscU/YscU/HrcU family type III secretion syste